MNIVFRIMLGVYAFCLTIISLIFMVITLRPDLFSVIAVDLQMLLMNPNLRIASFLIEALFFGLSIVFLLSGVKSDKDKRSISKYNNNGEIRISLDSIENIALLATRKFSNVRDSKAYVMKKNDSIKIVVKMVVSMDTNIPSISEEIQAKIRKAVEESSGIPVDEVNVFVENIFSSYKSRVE